MTLRELYSQIRGKSTSGQLGKYQLLSRHERLLARYSTTMGGGTIKVSIRVYESGYVLYEEDDKAAVFHMDDICGKATLYDSLNDGLVSRNQRNIPDEVYMSSDWTLRLTLEGNDRIMHNREKVANDHMEFSYSGISEDMVQLGFTPDFFALIEEEISHQKMLEVFETLKKEMKPVQWDVYIMVKRDGKKQKEIASILGKTQQAVSKDYLAAEKKVEKLRELLMSMFYED